MSKHSPGPWRWSESAFCPGWLVDANGDFVVSPCEPAEVDVSEADAALIASAPALLEMLRELEWAGGESVSRCPECGARPERVRDVYFERPAEGMPGFVVAEGAPKRTVVPGGHEPDCRLVALLREADGAPAKEKP